MDECIFVDRPSECVACFDSRKLPCLLNKTHLLLSEGGKKEVAELARKAANSPVRYKKKAGESGRYPDKE